MPALTPPPCGWLECSSGSPLAFKSSSLREFPKEQQAPMVLLRCVPYPSPPRPWACPSSAFLGRYKCGAGSHNICCPGDNCWEKERGGYVEPLPGENACQLTFQPRPRWALEHRDHSPTARGKRGPERQGPAPRLLEPGRNPGPLPRPQAFPPSRKQGLTMRP